MHSPDLTGVRVAFVAGTLGQGGAERQLFYMLRALVQHGASPRVLCLTRGEFWESRIRDLGVPVTWVGQSRSRLRRLWRIVRELERQPTDIVQSQHFYTNLYAAAAARVLGLPEIGAVRSDGVREVQSAPRFVGLASLRFPRAIAANSLNGLENAITLGVPRPRVHFLPNVVDTAQFACERHPGSDRVHVISVGRMVRQKRFDRFIRLVAALRGRALPVHGIVVGDGPLRPKLEAEARRLALDPADLELRGTVADTTSLYREADLLVLTSEWEGTPNVVLEAMASGLPVIATRVGGLADLIVDGENGYLVDRDDEDALAQVVADLVVDTEKRALFGRRARCFVEQYHAVPMLAAELRRLYGAVRNGAAQ